MFMHCPHVSFICAYQVFDKMPKWHSGVVLDSNEFQILGITMIELVYHALHMHHICTPHAHLMHTLAQLSIVLHFIDITCFRTYNMIM